VDAAAAELISHPLFSVLSDAARRDLREATIRRRVRRYEVVYAPGAPRDAAFLVRRGRVKVSRLFSDGREVTTCLCHSGDLFGEEALLAEAVEDRDGSGPALGRACQAQALDDCSLFVVPAALLRRLMQHEIMLAMGMMQLMGDRRRELEDQVEDLAFRDVGGRLARLLVTLANRQGVSTGDGRTLLNTRLTHQELANCVGTTRETLTLTIDRFKTDGWIRLEGRMIAICEPKALLARASDGRLPREDGRGLK
jgi:CRP/FNR family cyclic AMP-dependent transcriptional regulator